MAEQVVFKYNNFKRMIISFMYLFMILIGFFLILIENWFAVLFGILLIIIGLLSALDILFFKVLSLNDKHLIKEWFVFGKKKIGLNDLEVSVVKRVWTGTITFRDKKKKSFTQFFMNFETFPIGNDGFREIKKMLIEKKIIKGDEHEWNY
jgi:hypothetical protein